MNITVHFRPNLSRLAMTFFFTALFFGSLNATVFTVTKTADTNDGVCNADCSLREAIALANSSFADDIIEFDPAVFATVQTILLNSNSLIIGNNGTLTINGTGADRLSISGNNSVRVFQINSANVTIRRLKITLGVGFFGAGCIVNNADSIATLEDVVVSSCRTFVPDPISSVNGGGITNIGTMNIVRSRIEFNIVNRPSYVPFANGGGIINLTGATLRLLDSSVNNNYVIGGGGGGIKNDGQFIMINSTVSGNEATDEQNGNGGGILNNGVADILHSTIAYNRASISGGGVSTFGKVSLFNSRNSIYSNNTVGGNNQDFRGTLTSGGYNLVKDTTDTIITGDTTGNILGQDPLLQPLGNNGGISLYHIPAANSPVIDKGKTFDIFNDQRTLIRPFDNPTIPNAEGGDGADIGSIELQFTKSSTATPFDFDGDHKTDIAFFRPSNGNWFILRSEDSTFYSFPFGLSEDIPAPGDYDGDGRADVGVFRPSQATWYVLRSRDASVLTVRFGIAEDQPVVADYDGDGKADIAVYRPTPGEWWILRSSAGLLAVQFGQTGDRTVQGDYTGDGKTDIAVWRESNGNWYILRSEDNSFFAFPFGSTGDVPVPGDYDGDGKTDAGVFRPSNSVWYLQRSTAGVSIQQFGVAGDQPTPNTFVRQ